MGTVAFVHDHCFIEAKGLHYSTGKLTARTWERYLSSFERVRVIGTVRPMRQDETPDKFSKSSATSVEFSTIPKMGGLSRIFVRQRHRAFIRAVLEGVDAVVVRLPSYLGMIALREAEKIGVPVGVEVVGCPLDSYRNHGSLLGKIIAPIAYTAMRSAMERVPDVAVYVTQEFLQRRYPTVAQHVFTASNVELPPGRVWQSIAMGRRARLDARKLGEPIGIGFIGSLDTKYKGLEDLIRALGRVDFAFRLFVLGEGRTNAHVKLVEEVGIADRIEFVDPLPGGVAVAEWLSTLDLYCQPSHTEGLPRALVEALAAGLVCIGSDAGGIPELVPTDFVFPAKSVSALCELLCRCHGMDDKEVLAVAKRNFEHSAFFDPTRLHEIRTSAWRELAALASTPAIEAA